MIALIILISFASINIATAQIPTIEWTFDFNDNAFGQSAAADIDGDGKLEIIFSTYRNDNSLYVINAEDGTVLWSVNTGGCNDSAPLICDVNSDGALEIVLAESCVPVTTCFNGATGAVIWQTDTRGSDSPPSIADIDGDGALEILHGQFEGWVVCLDAATGAKKWDLPVDTNSWIQTAPTIEGLDGDGALDFVVANWSFGDEHRIFAFRGVDHSLLWESTLPDNYFYNGSTVADIDGDGTKEVLIACYDTYLYVLNGEDGSLQWRYSYSPESWYYAAAPVIVADINGDEVLDELFFSGPMAILLNPEGDTLWTFNMRNYTSSFRGAALSDINEEPGMEIAFGTNDGRLFLISGSDGSEIWSINLWEQYGDTLEIDHAPLIADFNQDSKMDVFIIGGKTNYPDVENNYGRAYMITAGDGSGPDWLMFQRNECRNPFIPVQHTGVENKQVLSENLIKTAFIRDDKLFFDIKSKAQSINLALYDVLGRTIYTNSFQLPDAGNISLDLYDVKLNSGLYFLSIIMDNSYCSAPILVFKD
jgi:outer membrane protein assembly factor BamB